MEARVILVSKHEAFLQAIIAAPADDAPRLIYADWLEENGDPTRAEFIRLRIQLREQRGRKKALARLAELSADVDGDWRRQVFAVPRLAIKKYRRVEQPVHEPVTKFGGQPVWLGEPAWPISRNYGPMQFVCQVAV